MTPPASRIRLVVLFGGRSAEHDVSCVTAVSVLRALDPARYDIVPVGITQDGRWVQATEAQRLLANGAADALPAALEAKGEELEPFRAVGPSIEADTTVVLPLLHGPFGEDGTVQGLCELADVPYVGSAVLGSAVAMDKIVAKQLLAAAGLPIPRYVGFREDRAATYIAAETGLPLPVFVKPANLGSSVGVTKAATTQELEAAIAAALHYDEWVIVEEAIVGREIECGVLGDRQPKASLPGEVRPSREFYDYEDKYEAGTAELLVPAPLPDDVTAEIQRLAVAAFEAVRAEGMARVDFFCEPSGRILVNEVNTIPGFTPISMYPRMWEASGVPYAELLDRLVQLALDRHARRAGRVGRARTAGTAGTRGAPPGR